MSAPGAIIMSIFAAVWWLAGTHLSGYGSPLLYGAGLIVAAAIIAAAVRTPKVVFACPEEEARQGRLVGIASGVEGLAILIAVNVCVHIKRPDLIVVVVAVVVGLHFIPLALWLPAPSYYATSALLIVIGLAGAGIADPLQRILIVSFGAACVLWLTSISVLVRVHSSALRKG